MAFDINNPPTRKKTFTSADIGQEQRSVGDVRIDAEQARAASLWANPQQLLAGLPKPSAFQSAVNAGMQGLKAGLAMPTASPEVAALTGALTGLSSQMPFEQQYQQNVAEQMRMLPVKVVMPSMAQELPELADMPFEQFLSVAGPYSNLMNKRTPPVSDATWAIVTQAYPGITREGLSEKSALEIMKEGGRMGRAGGEKITAEDPLLDEYSKTLNVPKQNLVGKDSKTITNWYGRIKTRQERVSYGEPTPILNNDGDVIGYYQTSSQGKIAPNIMPLAAGASQKQKDLAAVTNIMVDLFNTVKGFAPESGPMQRLVGFKESIKARAGLAADKKAFMDSLDSFLGNLSREYSGERGVLTDQDVSRIKAALPSLYDTEEEIDFKLKQIYKVIAERQKAISGGAAIVPGVSKPGASKDADPLGIR